MQPGVLTAILAKRYCAEARAAFAAMTVQPSDALKVLYNTAIMGLKAAGTWAKRDLIYLLNVETAQAARVNLKTPGTYDLTATGGPTFTAKVGYAGNGTTAYLDTGFNPATAGGQFIRDSANLTAGSLKLGTDAGLLIAQIVLGSSSYIYPRFTDSTTYARANSSAAVELASVTDGRAVWSINRSGASAAQLYKDGVSVGTGADASVALASSNVALFRSGTAYFNGGAWRGAAGGSLTAGEIAAENAVLAAFKAGVDALP